eukprot:CAMPEP_0198281934 /NCGR_PEP_ID=MMETSP1449-20131203/1819_1 /TAXON_ID=420275 /ORGANISM="Attheya septentrionalis, Strain CCMP2084" /LENGTH=69 /DNA_ID=CAMNT_0043977961 /DNA_START=102 /DNA_END=311 /DNA_ORIENTATION=+
MAVPRRRQNKGLRNIRNLPFLALKLFDANFVFQKTRTLLLYGFAPAVIYIGMTTEPTPSSWFELINILE